MVTRLQGWQDEWGWRFSGRKTARYRQIGNVFPPPVAEAVGAAIRRALEHAGPPQTAEVMLPVHDPVFRVLRSRDDFLTARQIAALAPGVSAAAVLGRLRQLSQDFELEIARSRGGPPTGSAVQGLPRPARPRPPPAFRRRPGHHQLTRFTPAGDTQVRDQGALEPHTRPRDHPEDDMSEDYGDQPVLDTLTEITAVSVEHNSLSPREYILARLAALVAVDAPPISWLATAPAVTESGLTMEDIRHHDRGGPGRGHAPGDGGRRAHHAGPGLAIAVTDAELADELGEGA